MILKRTDRIGSSATGPSRVAHWKPETTESLISFRYWTALVWSTSKLGPLVSGPKHQIFRASVTSHPCSSAKRRARSLKSSRGPILPASMAFATSSSSGSAVMYRRLCLLGDFDRAVMLDLAPTDSRYGTTGSEILNGTPAWS